MLTSSSTLPRKTPQAHDLESGKASCQNDMMAQYARSEKTFRIMTNTDEKNPFHLSIRRSGPWPFVSRHDVLYADGTVHVLESRHVRKNLHREHLKTGASSAGELPAALNRYIGAIFALGAALFGAASGLSLAPALTQRLALNTADISALFFAGSIPFTVAAYLQLLQAANAPPWEHRTPVRPEFIWIGWRPRDIGWLSCILQFAGTLLFNINTYEGMRTQLDWIELDSLVWAPDIAGSLLFLASGYLAFVETCHRYLAWLPQSLNWWVTALNLAGCAAFMIAAIYSFSPPPHHAMANPDIAIAFTFAGAIAFFSGSLLMLAE